MVLPGDYLGMMWSNLLMYVFGNPAYLGLFMLLAVTIFMYRLNLGLDAMLVVWIPIIFMMSWSYLGLSSTWLATVGSIFFGFLVILIGKKMLQR